MTDKVIQGVAAEETVPTPVKKKKKSASLEKKKARSGWLFILPFVFGFIAVYLPMIVESIWSTFNELVPLMEGGFDYNFVGLENYRYALTTDPEFARTLTEGLKNLAIDVPAILLFSLFMAVLLNQKMAGRAAFRAIFFLPVILATGIMEVIEANNILGQYMEESGGIDNGSGSSAATSLVSAMDIKQLFAGMKVGTGLVKVVTDLANNIFDIVNHSGVQMLIFLAGLQSISPAIYESCKIDGASAWETFWKITFPMLSPMILVNAVYTIIDSFTTESNIVMSYIKSIDVQGEEIHSTTMAWMYFSIVILIIGAVAGIISLFVFYQKKD